MMISTRRRFLKGLLASSATLSHATLSTRLRADGPATRPLAGKLVHWIVPYSVGGGFDAYSRLVEPFLEPTLDAQIVIKNMPGGGGVVAAKWLTSAPADGTVVALVNAPGLLVASMVGVENVPHPMNDFTVLVRLAQDKKIWVTGRESAVRTIHDLLDEAINRPITVGITGIGSPNFTGAVIASHLLGFTAEYVPGFSGSREALLSAVRGEIDVVPLTYESTLDFIGSGDVRPLLQVTTAPISNHPALKGVPTIGGADGIAAHVARNRGMDPEEAQADAATLASLMAAGRLVVAPPGLRPSISSYLEDALYTTLTDSRLVEAARSAKRPLHVARAAEVVADFQNAAKRLSTFLPIVEKSIARVRQ